MGAKRSVGTLTTENAREIGVLEKSLLGMALDTVPGLPAAIALALASPALSRCAGAAPLGTL